MRALQGLEKVEKLELWKYEECHYFVFFLWSTDFSYITITPTMNYYNIYLYILDLLTEVHERNCALRAVGREKETENISLVVSIGVYVTFFSSEAIL